MDIESLPRQARDFLRKLDGRLEELSAEQRETARDRVIERVSGGLASGEKITGIMHGLGPVDDFASAYREEVRAAAAIELASFRSTGMLHLVAVVVAALTGVFIAFVLPAFAVVQTSGAGGGAGSGVEQGRTLAQEYGAGYALLALAPALLAVLPLLVPLKWRMPLSIVNAVVITGVAGFATFTIGMFYTPLAAVMWAAVLVPWRMPKGFALASRLRWRLAFGALIALPGVLIAGGGISGSTQLDAVGWGMISVAVLLGALVIAGVRLAGLVTGVLGLAILVFTMTSPGLLLLAAWWIGGLYAALGFSAYVAWGRKPEGNERA